MAEDTTVKCVENGPYLVSGPIQVTDHLGNTFSLPAGKPSIALCRCGHSAKRPFCDGAHRTVQFKAGETATVQ